MSTPHDVFLRGVWRSIIKDGHDPSWVDRIAGLPGDDGPYGDYGPLVRRMLAAGIPASDIARFAQIVSYECAGDLCYHLDHGYRSYEGFPDDGEPKVEWGLFLLDPETYEPIERLESLYELILSADPSGREMRP